MAYETGLLVLTDSHGIDYLHRYETWKPLAVRVDQKNADCICFINVDSFYCEAVVLLDTAKPFIPWNEGGKRSASLVLACIAEVCDFVEPFGAIDHSLVISCTELIQTMVPALHHEVYKVENTGKFLYGPARPRPINHLILDEHVLNMRDFEVVAALRYLMSERGGNSLARIMEHDAPTVNTSPVSLQNLPQNWERQIPAAQRAETLALLNSLHGSIDTTAKGA